MSHFFSKYFKILFKTSNFAFAILIVLCFQNEALAQNAEMDEERAKQLESMGMTIPNIEQIRELANQEFDKPIEDQSVETLKELAKQSNVLANLVAKITNEYDDYIRSNSRYEFVTDKVKSAPAVSDYLSFDSEFKTIRNRAYFNLGLKTLNEGKKLEAFLYFNDATACPSVFRQNLMYNSASSEG